MFPEINKIYPDLLKDIKLYRIQENPEELEGILLLTPFLDKEKGVVLYRQNIRKNKLVDQFWINKYINYYEKNLIFTNLDCIGKNVINVPLGFMPAKNISQDIKYYQYHNKEVLYNKKIFWKGRTFTHQIRTKILDFLECKNNPNINISYWNPIGSPYLDNKPPKTEYDNFFNQLQASDMFLVIRGDLPWLFSFFDAIRAGCIPVCIDTFYGNLGWENIGIKKEDILLDFNTDIDSFEYIYETISELILNKDKILFMKNNVINFYKQYILTDSYLKHTHTKFHTAGWGNFYIAKLLEIVENNYKINNNQFICSKFKEIINYEF